MASAEVKLNVRLRETVVFWYLKYICWAFFFTLFIKSKDVSSALTLSFFLYASSYALLFSLFFSFPLFFVFRLSKRIYSILILLLVLIGEFIAYVFLTSQKFNDVNGIYNSLLTVIGIVIFVGIKMVFPVKHSPSTINDDNDTL